MSVSASLHYSQECALPDDPGDILKRKGRGGGGGGGKGGGESRDTWSLKTRRTPKLISEVRGGKKTARSQEEGTNLIFRQIKQVGLFMSAVDHLPSRVKQTKCPLKERFAS